MNVESQSIREIEYFAEEEVLEIKFHNNKTTYVYFAVEPETAAALIAADSIGRFYNQNIRGFYDSQKHPPPPNPNSR